MRGGGGGGGWPGLAWRGWPHLFAITCSICKLFANLFANSTLQRLTIARCQDQGKDNVLSLLCSPAHVSGISLKWSLQIGLQIGDGFATTRRWAAQARARPGPGPGQGQGGPGPGPGFRGGPGGQEGKPESHTGQARPPGLPGRSHVFASTPPRQHAKLYCHSHSNLTGRGSSHKTHKQTCTANITRCNLCHANSSKTQS